MSGPSRGDTGVVDLDIEEQLAKTAKRLSSPSDAAEAAKKAQRRFERLDGRVPHPLKALWTDLKLLIRFVRDFTSGRYKGAQWRSVVVAAAAILYFAWTIDLIPDFILVIGFIDDAALIALALKLIHDDLQVYDAWLNGPPVELVDIRKRDDESRVNLFVHGYKALTSAARFEVMCDAIVRTGLPGRSILLTWKSGDWSVPKAMSVLTRMHPAKAILGQAINEFSEFNLAQARAENLGRRLGAILDRRSDLSGATIHLVGQSLGTHVIHHALHQADLKRYRIGDCVCISGVARTNRPDWTACVSRINGRVYNLYNPNDVIVNIPNLWAKRIGLQPLIAEPADKLVNLKHDVDHTRCWAEMPTLLGMIWPSGRSSHAVVS